MRLSSYITIAAVILSGCGNDEKKSTNNTLSTPKTPPSAKRPPQVFLEEYKKVMGELSAVGDLKTLDCTVVSFMIGEAKYTETSVLGVWKFHGTGYEFLVHHMFTGKGDIELKLLKSYHASRVAFSRALEGSFLKTDRLPLYAPPIAKFSYLDDSKAKLCDLVTYAVVKTDTQKTWREFVAIQSLDERTEMIVRSIQLLQNLHKEGFCFSPTTVSDPGFSMFTLVGSQLVLNSEGAVFTAINPMLQVNVEKGKAASQSAVAVDEHVNLAAQNLIALAKTLESELYTKLADRVLEVVKNMHAAMDKILTKEEAPNYDEWIRELTKFSDN